MSEDRLYAIARQRIDQRNRRLRLWAVNLGALILSLAFLILTGTTFAAAIFMAMAGVFTLHTILMGLAETRDKDIEKEVARLRSVVNGVYEKPKRLELSEDGELLDFEDTPSQADKREDYHV